MSIGSISLPPNTQPLQIQAQNQANLAQGLNNNNRNKGVAPSSGPDSTFSSLLSALSK